MSEENVEIVRDAWRAFIERGLDGSAGYYAEDSVIEALPEAPDRATRHGREGILRDSLVVRDRPFGSKDQALEAAGLSE